MIQIVDGDLLSNKSDKVKNTFSYDFASFYYRLPLNLSETTLHNSLKLKNNAALLKKICKPFLKQQKLITVINQTQKRNSLSYSFDAIPSLPQ